MAKKLTVQEKIDILKKIPGVALTGDESVKELDALIKKHNGVEPAETVEEKDEVQVPVEKASKAVHFILVDGHKRSFTEKDHGKKFNEVADEFHKTNKSRIHSRKDE